MFRFNSKDTKNTWKLLLEELQSGKALDDISNKFIQQLSIDEANSNINTKVSECAYYAPRIGSSLDKKYNIARNIALKKYKIDENDLVRDFTTKKKWSYIQYQKLISNLSKVFKEQIEREYTLTGKFKNILKDSQRKYFCELKNKPVSNIILNPTAMPVEISSIEDLNPFFDHLKSNQPIEDTKINFLRGIHYNDGRMDLCKQVVGPTHIDELMNSLKNNTQIEHFLLGNNIIGLKGSEAIAKFLLDNNKPKIKTWYLAGNDINDEGAKLLSEALKHNTICEALWLKRNPIKPNGAKYIGELLEINKSIKVLDMHNTGILDQGVEYLMNSLKKNNTLRHLYLDANGLTHLSSRYISEYFDHLVTNNIKGITSLWLDINRIDDEGIITLSNSLKNYKYLKRLIVGSNRLTHLSAKALCENLNYCPNLKVLDIGF